MANALPDFKSTCIRLRRWVNLSQQKWVNLSQRYSLNDGIEHKGVLVMKKRWPKRPGRIRQGGRDNDRK